MRAVGNAAAALVFVAATLAVAPLRAQAAPVDDDAWLHGQLVGPPDLLGFGVVGDTPVPVTDVIGGSGAYYEDVRNQSIRVSHSRVLESFDGRREVDIRLTEYVNHAFAGTLAHKLSATPPAGGPMHAPDARGKVLPMANGQSSVAINEVRGRIAVEVVARVGTTNHPGSAREALTLARQVGDAQYELLADTPDLVTSETISLQRERWALLAGILWFLVVIQVLAAGLAVVRDRSTRERLLRRLLRSRTPALGPGAWVIDATSDARRLRWRHRGGVLLRNAGLLALVVATYGLPTRWELAVILGLALAGSLVELVVARVRRQSGLRAAYGTGALLARVATSTVTIALIGVASQLLLVTVMGSGMTPAGMTPTTARSAVLLFLTLGLVTLGLADLVGRIGRRIALRSAGHILARDSRPEILLLRSFMDDRLTVRAHRTGRQAVLDRLTLRRFDLFEDILAWALWRYGPMVAFGDHWLPPLGAARVSVPTGVDWHAMVWNRLGSSQLIVMSVGRTRAVVEEITMIRQAGALAKTVFIFPPVPEAELRARLQFVTQALELRRDILQPAYQPNRRLLALTFDGLGNPVCVLGDGRDDLSYQAAVTQTVAAIRSRPTASAHSPATGVRQPRVASEHWLEPVAVPASARRKVARRRFWAVAPWVGVAVLQLFSLILALPPAQPTVTTPGRILSRAPTNGNAAVDGFLVYTDSDRKRLVALDPDGHASTAVTLPVTPIQLFAARNTVYATTIDKPGVVAVDHSSAGFITAWTATLAAAPFAVAQAGSRVFASLPGLNTVAVLDAATGAQVASIRSLRGPVWLATDGRSMVVASVTDSTLTWFDAVTLKAGASVRVPNPSALLNTGSDLLVGSTEDSSVTALDLGTHRLRARVNGIRVGGVLAVADSRILVATYGKRPEVIVFDSDLRRIAATPVPSEVDNLTPFGASVVWNLGDVPAMTAVPIPTCPSEASIGGGGGVACR